MKSNIENYITEPCKGGLKITLDQREIARKGIHFIFVMLLASIVICPYGPLPVKFFSPFWFAVWIIGWSISGSLCWYVTDWREQFILTRHKLTVSQIRKGKVIKDTNIKIGDHLKVSVHVNRGTRTGSGSGLASHYSPPVFAYSVYVTGLFNQSTEFSLHSRASVDELIVALKTVVPVEISRNGD